MSEHGHDNGKHDDAPKAPLRAAVIVTSDRAHAGTYDDQAGPAAVRWLAAKGFDLIDKVVIPDDGATIVDTLVAMVDKKVDLVVTSGGTGLSPRDVTPQALDRACDYHVPGIGELLRQESLKYSLNAYLSRCGGWVKERTLVLALPGNPKAVTEQLDILAELLPHALSAVRGECKHRRKTQ
jgi:molybdenum cofactor synthesis domain-containing protein